MCNKYTLLKILRIYLKFAEFFKKLLLFLKNAIFLLFKNTAKLNYFYFFPILLFEELKFFKFVITLIVFLIEFLIL